MMKLKDSHKKWLVSFHLLFVIVWLGTVITMYVFLLYKVDEGNVDQMTLIHSILKLFYNALLLPSAIGCIITGFFLSLLTHWGLTKYIWIIIKWVVSFNMIFFITLFLGGWVDQPANILLMEGVEAVKNPHFVENTKWLKFGIGLQIPHLIVLVFISIIKPWGKRKKVIQHSEFM